VKDAPPGTATAQGAGVGGAGRRCGQAARESVVRESAARESAARESAARESGQSAAWESAARESAARESAVRAGGAGRRRGQARALPDMA
jgi:hypothetical protein